MGRGKRNPRFAAQSDDLDASDTESAASASASQADSTDPLQDDRPSEDSDLEFRQEEVVRCGRDDGQAATEAEVEGEAEVMDDVGQFAILCGNWAGQRSKLVPRQHVERDLRSSPAHFLILQEAHKNWQTLLEQPYQQGDPEAEDPLQRRNEYQYFTLLARGRGETNSDTTLLVAGRESHCNSVTQLRFKKRWDGRYRGKKQAEGSGSSGSASGSTVVAQLEKRYRMAYSRFQMVHVKFKRPQSGLSGMTVLNTHMHFMTAKNSSGGGFKKAHNTFWTLLASWIKEHDVRVLAGDFNMALWLVVPRLAEHGIHMQYVASYAWESLESPAVHVDSCGVFVRGSWSIKRSFEFEDFFPDPKILRAAMDRGRGEIYDSEAEDEADDYVPGGEYARPIYAKLHSFLKGQGFPITSYLGPDGVKDTAEDAMRELLWVCFNPTLEDKQTAMFPRVKQKLLDPEIFDPRRELFAAGVHMPLLVYVGNGQPERGTAAWGKRELRTQAYHERMEAKRQERWARAAAKEAKKQQEAWGAETAWRDDDAAAPWDGPAKWTATADPRSRKADDQGRSYTGTFHGAWRRVQEWKANASRVSRPPWDSEAGSSGARGSNQGAAWAPHADVRGNSWQSVSQGNAWAQPGEASWHDETWHEDAWPPLRR